MVKTAIFLLYISVRAFLSDISINKTILSETSLYTVYVSFWHHTSVPEHHNKIELVVSAIKHNLHLCSALHPQSIKHQTKPSKNSLIGWFRVALNGI